MAFLPHTFEEAFDDAGLCDRAITGGIGSPEATIQLPYDQRRKRGAISLALAGAINVPTRQISDGHEFDLPTTVFGHLVRAQWTRQVQVVEPARGCRLKILLDKVPTVDHFDLRLTLPQGTRVSPQNELTQEDIDRGCKRPEPVVNSLAFYGGRFRDKLGHLYRPHCEIAAKPLERAWCDLERVKASSLVRLHLPMAWLQSVQQWPVLIDPDFGYTTKGGSTTDMPSNNISVHGPYTAPEAGTITHIGWHNRNDSTARKFACYSDDSSYPDALKDTTNEDTSSVDDWDMIAANTGYIFASAEVLWVANNSSGGLNCYYDDVHATYGYKYVADTYNGFDDPYPGGATSSTLEVSAKITYTAAAAGHPARRRFGGIPGAASPTPQGVHVW